MEIPLSKEETIKIISESQSLKEVCQKIFGGKTTCRINAIKQFINSNNIPVEHFDVKYNSNLNITKIHTRVLVCQNCGKEFNYEYGHKKKFCADQCRQEFKHKKAYQKILNGDESIMHSDYMPRYFKEDIIKEQNGVCAICGISPEWNNKPLVFILDHIDGDASNNKRDNLRCICPNCDSQLDTFKSKNKNCTRTYRYATKK